MRLAERKTGFVRARYQLVSLSVLCALTILGTASPGAPSGQESQGQTTRIGQAQVPAAIPLAKLVQEAERNNPQILAALHAWKAATQVPSQANALPDPQVVVQNLSVGSPRPLAGFTNSDFAYLGIGFSQDLPYPGKLRLRGEIAARDAAAERERYEATRRSVIEQVEEAYFRLAYEQKALLSIDRDGALLDQIEKVAEARYRVGRGNQQDVLKAQLQRTKLLRDAEMHHREHRRLQAQLTQLLGRLADASEIAAEDLTETPLHYGFEELRGLVRAQNPDLRAEQEMVRRQSLQVEAARKGFYPDFSLQYLWQHTGPQFRDYYMLTFGVRVPIYSHRKQRPELAQAVEELSRSRRAYEAQVQQTYFEIRDQLLTAETAARVLKIYREGLIPQATGTFQAGLGAYEANREDFETLFSSFMDVLNLDEEYWRELANHEIALAQLERLAGVTLH